MQNDPEILVGMFLVIDGWEIGEILAVRPKSVVFRMSGMDDPIVEKITADQLRSDYPLFSSYEDAKAWIHKELEELAAMEESNTHKADEEGEEEDLFPY